VFTEGLPPKEEGREGGGRRGEERQEGKASGRNPHLRVTQAALEDLPAHLGIQRGEGIVEEVDVSVGVHGAGQGKSLLLPARESHPPLPDLSLVA